MDKQEHTAPQRLDAYLAACGYYETKARARDAIRRGCIAIDGKPCLKPGHTVRAPRAIVVNDPARRYVSRSALKLVEGLKASKFDPAGRLAADLGASTGGFTQVLLERGARHVHAIDVGHDQLASLLRDDPRVTSQEGLNIRDLAIDHFRGSRPEFLTADLSFISLKLALPKALEIAAPGALGVFLVKPQFEVGREHLTRAGLVRDEALQLEVAEDMMQWLDRQSGWRSTLVIPSPIQGGDGNREFLLAGKKDA